MATVIPTQWDTETAYALDDKVYFNGVGYQATAAVAASSNNPVGNTNWKVYAVFQVMDFYSLQEAIELSIESSSPEIINSIPLYINNVEEKISDTLRHPAQLKRRILTINADGVLTLPQGILDIEHLRRDSEGQSYTIEGNGTITLKRAKSKTHYERIIKAYEVNSRIGTVAGATYPTYWIEGRKAYVAPKYKSGDTFELSYYEAVPRLGTYGVRQNSQGEQLNSDGQTLAEWVADGNAAADFVAQIILVTTNLWTKTAGNLIRAGALSDIYRDLHNVDLMPVWDAQFKSLHEATKKKYDDFRNSGAQAQQSRNPNIY